MAVGFFLNEDDEHYNGSYQTVITTNSATQTPLQSPVSREYLVQAFCEALHRCSIAGSPSILTSPPPSPSCSHPNANSDVFFPRSTSHTSSGSSSSSSSIQPQTPTSIRMHDDYRSARATVPRRRYRLTSASDEDDFDDDVVPLFDDYEEHMQYMAARERLQEFPGRIPPRKKRNQSNANNDARKAKEQKYWPAVAATVALAFGLGYFVTR